MLLLKLLPAPWHRALYRLAHFVRRQVWNVRKPHLEGVRVLVLDPQGKLLLVRHSYGSDKWMPPGGGLRPGEDPVKAGARELHEETGCVLQDGRLVTLSDETLYGARNQVHVIVGRTQGKPRPDQREIIAARFFPLDDLPQSLQTGLRERIGAWVAPYGD